MRNLSTALVYLFAAGDLVLLNSAIFLSYWLTTGWPVADSESMVYLFIFSNLSWLFLMLVINPYRRPTVRPLTLIARSHFSFLFTHLLIVVSLILFSDKTYHAGQLTAFYVSFLSVTFLWKLVFFYLLQKASGRSSGMVNYVIVGEGELAADIRKELRTHPERGYRFAAQFAEAEILNESVPFGSVQSFCLTHDVKEIYCCLPEIRNLDLRKLIDFGLNHFIKVVLVQDFHSFYQEGIQLEPHHRMPVWNTSAVPLDDMTNRFVKRAFDLLFAGTVSLVILTWLFPLVAVLIKLDSRGPILFRQRRAGKRNRPFECLKFRTMAWSGDDGFVQATKNDPRITRVGRILRKTSLDEFPQFLNVLAGDMSVVGPRPHPIKLNDDYLPRIKKLMSRHYVKPGVTGLAQCMGYRGETTNFHDMKNRITLDRFYVQNWSMWFDIRIIVQTVYSLIRNSAKAY